MNSRVITILVVFLVGFLLTAPLHAQQKEGDVGGNEVVLDQAEFEAWLKELKDEALEKNISETLLDDVIAEIKLLPKVIELDRKQPEKTITFKEYARRVVPTSRVRRGRKLLEENHKLLQEIGNAYKIQPRFIVALWGIETDFGRNMGGFYVPSSLATLAFEGRRSAFFRKELLVALWILEKGHTVSEHMKGSWAGAMGQTQFMPSSFVNFAVDHDGDGRKDIWQSKSDVFASIANYLAQSGWDDSATWGRRVKLPPNFPVELADVKIEKTLEEWNALGVVRSNGSPLPTRDLMASIVLPGGEKGHAFIVYENYKSLLKWNRSLYFATAVGLLSDEIGRR